MKSSDSEVLTNKIKSSPGPMATDAASPALRAKLWEEIGHILSSVDGNLVKEATLIFKMK